MNPLEASRCLTNRNRKGAGSDSRFLARDENPACTTRLVQCDSLIGFLSEGGSSFLWWLIADCGRICLQIVRLPAACHIRPSAIRQMAGSKEWPKPAVLRCSCGNSLGGIHRSLWQNLSVNCQGLPAVLPFGWPAAPHVQPPKVPPQPVRKWWQFFFPSRNPG